MGKIDADIIALGVALGVGLLVGIERERSKGRGPGRKPGGIRTFGLFALMGGIAGVLGSDWMTATVVLAATAFGVAAYLRSTTTDPG
ncbi:MAG: MgtC/SapB family protein, partial [Steroidobacteraceae bacterium]|nr:MgtC/SapB family protein [Steroidobacteraceae bacterium]